MGMKSMLAILYRVQIKLSLSSNAIFSFMPRMNVVFSFSELTTCAASVVNEGNGTELKLGEVDLLELI